MKLCDLSGRIPRSHTRINYQERRSGRSTAIATLLEDNVPVQIGAKASDFTNPTALMADCHRRIEGFLRALQAIAVLQGRQLAYDERKALENALRYFREAAPKHNADEEQSLFPRLRSLPNPEAGAALADCARLEQEHRWAAPLHAEADELGQRWLEQGVLAHEQAQAFAAAITRLSSMYSTHIELEDKMVFPLADRVLSATQKQEIAREMQDRRKAGDSAPGHLYASPYQRGS